MKKWKKFEKNNETIALNILQIPHDEIEITMHISRNIIIHAKIK